MAVKKNIAKKSENLKKETETILTKEPEVMYPTQFEKLQLELAKIKIEVFNLKIENLKLEKSLEVNIMNNLINSIRKNNNIPSKYILDLKTNNFNITTKHLENNIFKS